MSDSEEPRAKIPRSEPDDQSFEDVQEEWLNEDVLTDDDYNVLDQDSIVQNESLDMDLGLVTDDAQLTADRLMKNGKEDLSENIDTIDEYLDQFMDDDKDAQTNAWQTAQEAANNTASGAEVKEENYSDDSTDELLRVLGEEKPARPKLAVVKSAIVAVETKDEVSSEDEIFEGAKIRTVKLSKNILIKRSLSDAKGDTSDSEFSDDKTNIQRIFRPTSKRLQKAAKSTTKSSLTPKPDSAPAKVYSAPSKSVASVLKQGNEVTPQKSRATRSTSGVRSTPKTHLTPGTKSTLRTKSTPAAKLTPVAKTTPVAKSTPAAKSTPGLKSSQAKKSTPATKSVPASKSIPAARVTSGTRVTSELRVTSGTRTPMGKRTTPGAKSTTVSMKTEAELVKAKVSSEPVGRKLDTYKNVVINDENALKMLLEKTDDEEDSWDDGNIEYLDGEFEEELSEEEDFEEIKHADDVMMTDHDSEYSDYSLYDGIGTSESEDIEESFELDLRAERAADYVPMLGNAAYKFLTEERGRVTIKLTELRKVLSKLNESVRGQTAEIEVAKRRLRELNVQLNHT